MLHKHIHNAAIPMYLKTGTYIATKRGGMYFFNENALMLSQLQ